MRPMVGNAYRVPGTVLGLRDIDVNETAGPLLLGSCKALGSQTVDARMNKGAQCLLTLIWPKRKCNGALGRGGTGELGKGVRTLI